MRARGCSSLAFVVAAWVVAAQVMPLALAQSDVTAGDEVKRLLRALWMDAPAARLLPPAFSLPDTGGSPVRLADFEGRVVMLYFWTT